MRGCLALVDVSRLQKLEGADPAVAYLCRSSRDGSEEVRQRQCDL